MEHLLYPAILILLMTGWLYTVSVVRSRFPTLSEKAIVLLIAHPDDEAMFLGPTVLSLTRPELGNHLKILCLSNGNADGLGATRAREIEQSAIILGLRSSADVHVYDGPEFPDSMTETWSASAIASLLNSFFVKAPFTGKKKANDPSRGAAPTATIDVLITFDKGGVSGHPNHSSLYYGAVEWVKTLMRGKTGWEAPVTVYTLSSTNILRKYIGGFDLPLTMVQSVFSAFGSKRKSLPPRLMFANDALGYFSARKAMTQAHKSQMRWFRWGWISIGRYMFINDLKREKIA